MLVIKMHKYTTALSKVGYLRQIGENKLGYTLKQGTEFILDENQNIKRKENYIDIYDNKGNKNRVKYDKEFEN